MENKLSTYGYVMFCVVFVIIALMNPILLLSPAGAAGADGDGASIDHPSDGAEMVSLRKDLAWALEQSGDISGAEKVYRALVESGQADQETRIRYTWLLQKQKRYKEAWRVIRAVPQSDENPSIIDLQVRTAMLARQKDEALRLCRTASERGVLSRDLRAECRALLDGARDMPGLASAARDTMMSKDDMERGAECERLKDKHAAIKCYLKAVESHPVPVLYLRLARLYRWTSQPDEAMKWYRKFLDVAPHGDQWWRARSEYAAALLDAGYDEQGWEEIAPSVVKLSKSADVVLTAARAASQTGRTEKAVYFLEQLSKLRRLSRSEQVWMAGQYRAAGYSEKSLAAYEELAVGGGDVGPEVWEPIGDLKFDLGDYAGSLEAYMHVCPDLAQDFYPCSCSDTIILKIARGLSKTGHTRQAARAYECYVKAHNGEAESVLEAARFFAGVGDFARSKEYYQMAESLRGESGIRIEMAKVCMGAQDFACGERWARAALTTGEGKPGEARMLLGQALLARGEVLEAKKVFEDLHREDPEDPEATAWLARASAGADRHLAAYNLFSQAIRQESTEGAQLAALQARSAMMRQDYRRASKAYAAANGMGAGTSEEVGQCPELSTATAPVGTVPFTFFGDSNDFSMLQGGLAGAFWPGGAARISLLVMQGEIQQHDTSFDRTAASVGIDKFFATPALEVQGAVGFESFDLGDTMPTGRFGLTYSFEDNTRLGFQVERKSFWSDHDLRNPRQFNRIIHLEMIPPDFAITGGHVFYEKVFAGSNYHWFAQGGAEDYEDGNIRSFAYSHFQIPILDKDGVWFAVKPNLYFESFEDESSAYFSPDSYVVMGNIFHAIFKKNRFSAEAEFNPQALITEGDPGFGVMGMLDLSVDLGVCSVSVGSFTFYDARDDYSLWRVAGGFSRKF